MACDDFSYRIWGCGGSAAKALLGFASWSPGRLDVGPPPNSPRDAGSARSALKGKPFLFPLLRWTRCRRKNSNPAPVCVPVLPYRALTPRLAGRFSSASPLVRVLDSHAAIGGFAVRSPLNAGGQGPLGRVSTGAKAAQLPPAWGQSSAFSSLGSELRCLSVILSVRLGRTLGMSFSASGDAPKPHRLYALLGSATALATVGGCHAPGSAFWGTLRFKSFAERFAHKSTGRPQTKNTLVAFFDLHRFALPVLLVRYSFADLSFSALWGVLQNRPAKCAWALFASPIVGDWLAPLLWSFLHETTSDYLYSDGVALLNDH